MKNKSKPNLAKPTIRSTSRQLTANHAWKAPAGYKIMVLDRGTVSFNIPQDWILAKLEPVEIHDGEPPNDNARISVSFWHLPPGVDWSGLPLTKLLTDSLQGGSQSTIKMLERGKISEANRDSMELVWTQSRFLDLPQNREAYSRVAMMRGFNVAVLISFDFWVDDAKKLQPVWDELLRSINLGRSVADPTKGIVLQ
ncbi:MAG: hypothetical protein KF726_00090 [Anaerolineae bacterium]|nr:hypothetical protein [Anaerolineae bacterium]